MEKVIYFNRPEMIKFFQDLDYLNIKCEPFLNGLDLNKAPIVKKMMCDYELSKNHTVYADIKYYDIFEKIKKIYGNENDIARKMTYLYDFAISRLLDRYVDIDTLIKLFNHHFFEFEWRQHIDYNFKENKLSFYRDHFIHQIRNCYMVLKLLESEQKVKNGKIIIASSPLMSKIKDVLESSLDNELIKYVHVNINNYSDAVCSRIDSIEKKQFEDQSEYCCLKETAKSVKGNSGDYALEYLIRGTLIIATLFHDMGYPVVFMREHSSQLNEFISSIFPQDGLSFAKLNELLGTSLLFTLTPQKVLKSMYESHDHGAFSAFILLLHFYETGTIRSLGAVKKAMIELAALAIFNHTVGNYYKDHPECGYKPSFTSDPISYVLRFVDDLQEWERVYFEVHQSGELRYCEKCKMPIIRKWDSEIKEKINEAAERLIRNKVTIAFDKMTNDLLRDFDSLSAVLPEYNMKRLYVCGCNDDTDVECIIKFEDWHYSTGAFEKGTLFPDRRINYTVICTNAVYIPNGDNSIDKFYLDYDPFKSFYLLKLNPHALDYRIGDLKKLNDQFQFQENIRFEMVTNMTNNLFMLKFKMICNFFYELGHYAYRIWKISGCNDSNEARKYFQEINPVYLDIIGNAKQALVFFNDIGYLSSRLREVGVFVYDYKTEDSKEFGSMPFVSNNMENYLKDPDNNEKVKVYIDEFTNNIVKYLMREHEGRYFHNLKNTLKCYINFMGHVINGDEQSFKFAINSKYGYDAHYIDCCNYLFEDMCKQIISLREDKSLIPYYEKAFNKDIMAAVVETIMDPRYYNPHCIRRKKVNEGIMDFFDSFSDLYMFKEMYRFSQDNLKRRMGEYITDKEQNNT
ncbi:MAG: hypothetical protein J1F18_05730 [Lachnospiraceae bacterium]|nr:hypothetical protein [Lachnospiraceae bacterium]